MSDTLASASLPALYAPWIAALVGGAIPDETAATCDRCAMCAFEGAARDGDYFDPRLKCCTYLPALPNFLVGRVLADADPALARGRASVEARITAGVAVTPLGLGTPPVRRVVARHGREGFGRSRTLLCPHFVDEGGGLCSIWRHREATCATWYCKHVRGAVGLRFWRALQGLLTAIERALALDCALALGPGDEALSQLLHAAGAHDDPPSPDPIGAEELDGRASPEAYRAIWGRLADGGERDFYAACAARVAQLGLADVLARGGPEVRAHARLVAAAYGALTSTEVPAALTLGAFDVVSMDADAWRVSTYSRFDPLELPWRLLDVLHHFDGRPLAEVQAALLDAEGVELDDELARRLADFEVLVPPERLARGRARG